MLIHAVSVFESSDGDITKVVDKCLGVTSLSVFGGDLVLAKVRSELRCPLLGSSNVLVLR